MSLSVNCVADEIAQGVISRLSTSSLDLAPFNYQVSTRVPPHLRTFAFDSQASVIGFADDWHKSAVTFLEDALTESYGRLKPKAVIELPSSLTCQATLTAFRTVELRAEMGLRFAGSMTTFVGRNAPSDHLYIKTIRATAFLALTQAFFRHDHKFATTWLRNIVDSLVIGIVQTKFPKDAFTKTAVIRYNHHVPSGCLSLPSPNDCFLRVEPSMTVHQPIPASQIFSGMENIFMISTSSTPAAPSSSLQPTPASAHIPSQYATDQDHLGHKRPRE